MTNTPVTRQNPMPPNARAVDKQLLAEMGKLINCVRPGVVIDFNESNATATVQIAQQQITSISPLGVRTLAPGALIQSVPVHILGGGNCVATFPIAAGDECILLFNDREIDNWLIQGGTSSSPTFLRLHDASDAYAIVGVRSFPRALGAYSANSAQLRSVDGETVIDLNAATQTVSITAPTKILLNSPSVVITGGVTVQNSGSLPDAFIVTGTLQATGDVQANSGSISLVNHVHGGVQTGSGNTGPASG